MDVLWGLGGMVVLVGLAVVLSTNRRAIRLRTVGAAFALQLGFGVVVLYWSTGQWALERIPAGVQGVINSSGAGIEFVFGPVLPKEGLVFAFQVLPVIIFFASLTAVLYHWGVLQRVVEVLGGALQRLLGTGKAESVNAAANIFVGQTEAPLVIRPYVKGLRDRTNRSCRRDAGAHSAECHLPHGFGPLSGAHNAECHLSHRIRSQTSCPIRAISKSVGSVCGHGRWALDGGWFGPGRLLIAGCPIGISDRRELHGSAGRSADGQDHPARKS